MTAKMKTPYDESPRRFLQQKRRLALGEKPACMELCPARARYFGDLDDPNSEVCKAMEGCKVMRLKEEAGTEPNVYYIIG